MSKKEKQVQIPESLFVALWQYHVNDKHEFDDTIKKGLHAKMQAVMKRTEYSVYKNKSKSDAEREQARQNYLDMQEIPDDFRW